MINVKSHTRGEMRHTVSFLYFGGTVWVLKKYVFVFS